MTSAPPSIPIDAPALPLTPPDRLAAILEPLRAVVARDGLANGLAGPLILLICARLRFLLHRFAALAAAPPRARRPDPRRNRDRTGAKPRLPTRFAFLLRAIPGAATARAQLRDLLAEPDTIALVSSRPATGRALRPLCHLLGVRPPPGLRLPPRTRAARPGPARSPDPIALCLCPPEPAPDQASAWPRPPARYAARFFPRYIRRRRAAFAP